MIPIVNGATQILKFGIIITGLGHFKSVPLITIFIRLAQFIWLVTAVFLMFYRRLSGGDTSVGGLVGTASFVFNGSVNILILLESIFKKRYEKTYNQLENQIDYLLEQKWEMNKIKSSKNDSQYLFVRPLLLLWGIQILCESLKIWINAISKIQPVFWYTFPISISLRLRYIQIIVTIMKLNGRVDVFKKMLWRSTKKNAPKSLYETKIWQPYEPEEYLNLNYKRLIYLRIWEIYKVVNDCYGLSILLLFMTSFFDIVCNCYWTFTAIYKRQVFHKYVFNGATSMSLASLVMALFYYTDSSENNSRYIGCFISKLVKQPLGNKRYNDLVSEFSIQTLHQRFIITAKEFFTLNLGLLGSMVAAIVTYLVILIQFMFTEKNNRQRIHEAKMLETTTSMAIIALQNVTGFNDKYPTVADNLNDIARAVNHTVLANIKN
ncbi:gustatory receptor 23a isoform X2 [Stomoxys calcitrans]|uniref:Gustatory receptor n=1 Tax=Stomoxys calcitrans TaxID=35570 RepID=A0A1I8PIQ5_STOCA|nr:gustatory receptor 23a isoform X2 [Stomoxys calcitrans]XP_059222939.1 gustatory receptor 23a isoform X2 [Stomoxys calcitrans]XP_059222940.1 gustatory receptor 23a isoform X2 [Stomoxys calcitrans]